MKRRKFVKSVIGSSAAVSLINSTAFAKTSNEENISGIITKDENMYDVIVIGVGTMGSAACYYLSKNGAKILGLEQFDISHDKGSHAGQSRIIRKAYSEHPNYVPLLEKAYSNWKALESEAGFQLFYSTGLAYFGRSERSLLQGVKESASKYNVDINEFNQEETPQKFPQFKTPAGYESIFEADAGFVTPEKAILSMSKLAISHGAVIKNRETVESWELKNSEVVVKTNKGQYKAKKMIISSGAYTPAVIPDLSKNLKVTRQLISWVKPRNWEKFSLGNFPCWIMDHDNIPGAFYGFPILPIDKFQGPLGLKIAHHHGGEPIDPSEIHSFDESVELEKLKTFLIENIPDAFDSFITVKSCLYTYSPDENFILDFLPGYENNVAVACGFSGHGFKFAPVIGEILSDMILKGQTDLPIDFLALDRIR